MMKKLHMHWAILAFLMLLLAGPDVYGQITPEKARQELRSRGLDEDEVKRRMLARGIDLEQIDPTNIAQVNEAQRILQEVLAEMEAEKAQDTQEQREKTENLEDLSEEDVQEVAREGEDVIEAVQEGASVEEAIAEEVIGAQENILPPSTIYGQDLFRNQRIEVYRQSEDVKPPDSYILGVGDEVGVLIWGYSQENILFEINADGYIKPEGMPRIYLKGLRLDDARNLLRSRFGQYYRFRPQEFEVVVSFARTINVNIVGEVFNYGNFNMPATNTAFNALVAAGGPTDIGSVRNIKLIRAGEDFRQIDIYKYLQDPLIGESFYLQENDFIHVPVAERVVQIDGAINRPYRYELVDGEDLMQLIDYAAGLKENALTTSIQVTRYRDNEQLLIDVPLQQLIDSGQDFPIFDGDSVVIREISAPIRNVVSISGAVDGPGPYAIVPGETRISDVIARAELTPAAMTNVAYLRRLREDQVSVEYLLVPLQQVFLNPGGQDNLILHPGDSITIFSASDYTEQHEIEVEGAVRVPGSFRYDSGGNIKLAEAIFLAGGLQENVSDIGFIRRRDMNDFNLLSYIRVQVAQAVANPSSAANVSLQPGDIVVVYPATYFTDSLSFEVSGDVRSPGVYRFDHSIALQDALTMSGGLAYSADQSRIDIYRVDLSGNRTRTLAATVEVDELLRPIDGTDIPITPFDQVIVRRIPNFSLQQNISISGAITYDGSYALISDNERVSSIIKRAGGLLPDANPLAASLLRPSDSVGYIVLDLQAAMDHPGSAHDIILKDGDELSVPELVNLVTITGQTRAAELYPDRIINQGKINVAYEKGKNAKYYIDKYGAGVGKDGSRGRIYVVHANGRTERSKGVWPFRKYPTVQAGTEVVVGARPLKETRGERDPDREPIEWDRVVATTIGQATAVLSLILLIQRVN